MSDADATAEPSVTVEGITVTKSYEAEEFPVPAVAFDIRSERDDEAMVRLTDAVPESVPAGDLGFHPDYGSDHWSVEDGNAVFERRLDPNEEYRTVYGIRTADGDPEAFMTDPTLDVEGLGGGTEDAGTGSEPNSGTTPDGDSSQAARDVITGKSVTGLDDDDTVDDVDLSGAETGDGASEVDDDPSADGASTESAANAAVPAGGVGAALATELREGDLAEDDHEFLAEELKVEDAGSEVRLTHLQSRISDLEAYTDALEEFIDENGPARQLIEDMSEQLETIGDELDAQDDRTTENENDIAALDERTTTTEDDVESLDEGVADVEAELDATNEDVGDLRREIEDINGWREQISTVLGSAPESEEHAADDGDKDES